MECGINDKIKIVWICHFSDEKLQEKLPIWRKTPSFAAWIRNTLEGFINDDMFEIHVISPHQYLKRDVSFEEDGIFYHFFSIGVPFINRSWPAFFNIDLLSNYFLNKKKILKLISEIGPKLINLQGAENSYYSSVILKLYKKYPVLVTIQGFVSLEVFSKKDAIILDRIKVEEQVLKCCNFFGGDVDSKLIISNIKNDEFGFFEYLYPLGSGIKKYNNRNTLKVYDILFWGRVCKDKGAEDFIKLVANLKITLPNIKANIIGGASGNYFDELKNLAIKLDCLENINFNGFILETNELYLEVLKCKILILPTYNDRLPTVLREAMYLKLPIVSYRTGSIPGINHCQEVILLTDQGNLTELQSQTELLLNNQELFNQFSEKAFEFGVKEFGVEYNCQKMKDAYKTILNIN